MLYFDHDRRNITPVLQLTIYPQYEVVFMKIAETTAMYQFLRSPLSGIVQKT